MMHPVDPCLDIPTEDRTASPLPLSPSSSSSSLSDLTQSLSSQFLPSLCSSRTSCTEVSFELDPTPSCSELSQLSGRSYHGSPEASFLYPDYPSSVFSSSHFRASPDSSSTNLSPRCTECGSGLIYSDGKLGHTISSSSLLSIHQSGSISRSESFISVGAEDVISISSSESVINSESVTSITSSHSVISVASSTSCNETSSHAVINPVHPSGYKPVSLQTLFYHDLPYYQWTSFSNPASPSISFTDLILPNTSVSCSGTPLTEIPFCNYSTVPGPVSVIRDVTNRKRKRDDDGDDDDDDGLPSKRRCQ